MESVGSMMFLMQFVDIPVSDSLFYMYIYIYHTVLPIKLEYIYCIYIYYNDIGIHGLFDIIQYISNWYVYWFAQN